jgi:putative peptide zinc metalloprotease protein
VAHADAPIPDVGASPISEQQRCALLKNVPAFADLSDFAIGAVARDLSERDYASGEPIVSQGDVGDCVYLLAEGSAEVSLATPGGQAPVGVLRAGELFGEIALLQPDRLRMATVTAVTDVLALRLEAANFHEVLDRYPDARAAFRQAADQMIVVGFLKQASPFVPLDADRVRRLAARLEPVHVAVGEDIIRQGDVGDRCYLIRSGEAEVLLTTESGEVRRLATLPVGAVFGEAALLTDSPRNATVRALEPCELLALHRADLVEAVESDRELALHMLEMVQLRDLPRQVSGVLAVQRAMTDSSVVTTLKEPRRAAYYRLSAEGFYIWQQLDGEHSLRDITMGYLTTFGAFAPQAIADTIAGLAEAGFVEARSVKTRAADAAIRPALWERLALGARGVMEWETSLPNPDPAVTCLYRVVRWIYTRPAQVVLFLLFLSGVAVLATHLSEASHATVGGAWVIPALLVTYGVTILVHELGHALTVKAFGHEVPRAGVGWYWFGPIAYVDTSDMWLASRWPRIAVSIGGLYSSALLASAAAIGAVLVGSSLLSALLWQLSFLGFYLSVANLNPLMELDGYFLLMDWLDRPNLRRRCLAWLGNDLGRALHDRRELAAHRLEIFYGLGAALYIVFSSFLLLWVYCPVIRGWLHAFLPLTVAGVFAWLITGLLVVLALLTLAGELRGVRRAGR